MRRVLICAVQIWDNSDACCGDNKRFTGTLVFQCSPKYPYLTNPQMDRLDLDPLVITQRIGNIDINIKDITDTVRAQVSSVVHRAVSQVPLIDINGTIYTVVDAANLMLRDSFGYGDSFPCA